MSDRRLIDEFREIIEDVVPDFAASFADVDEEVAMTMEEIVYRIFTETDPTSADAGISESLHNMAAMLYWMFLVGREHAARGYSSPATRSGAAHPLVPDDLSGLEEGA